MSGGDRIRVFRIFASIQGESTFAGLPCSFVRLAGCPLDCAYCDTRDARDATGEEMRLTFAFTNKGNVDLRGGSKKVTIEIVSKGTDKDSVTFDELLVNQSIVHTFKFSFENEGDFPIKLGAYNREGPVDLYLDGQKSYELGTVSVVFVEEPFPSS